MTPPLFLCDGERFWTDDEVVLDGAEGRHAALVRRLRPGEPLDLGDGAGLVAHCEVAAVHADRLTCRVLRRARVPRLTPRLVIVQALAKGGRDEHAVEAMTEVGVDEVVPWAAARSVVQWHGARGERALARWRSTAREAAKQARRAYLPVVGPLATTPEVADRLGRCALAVVLHEGADEPISQVPLPDDGDVTLVVGPEGGITDDERAAFAAAGARSCRLGSTVLRTSTAGVAAAAIVSARTARWG